MTPDEFAEIVVRSNLTEIAVAVAPLNESQRRKLAGIAAELHKEVTTAPLAALGPRFECPTLIALRARLGDRCRPTTTACELALLGVGSLSQAKKALGYWEADAIDVFRRVVADRRPAWIDRWVEHCLSAPFGRLDWAFLRPLICAGVCAKPAFANYVRWMAGSLHGEAYRTHKPLSQVLLENPDLLEDVWGLFEVAAIVLARDEKDCDPAKEFEGWSDALIDLSQRGHLDRQKLLDASLKALSSGFKNRFLTGYIRFHERLKPTIEELACRQQAFLDLLTIPASHVVTFAMEKISQIERAGQLHGEAFLSRMLPALQTRSKGQPIAALNVAARIVHRSPELLPYAVSGVLEALGHPAADVQQKAIALIEEWTARLHPDHGAAIRERLDELCPTARSRAQAVVARTSSMPARETAARTDGDDFASTLAELARAAAELPMPWGQRAGLDGALGALRAGRMPRPLRFDLTEVRVLSGVRPIVPIAGLEELIDAVAHAVETVDSADEVERILDGISRLCDQRPADFERRIGSLVKRIEASDMDSGTRGLATRGLSPESIYHLLWLWLRGSLPPPRWESRGRAAIDRFLDGRVNELMFRVQSGRAAQMLAAPTHSGGWIAPLVFVKRLLEASRADIEIYEYDMIQALLRLAPDDRAEALAQAVVLPGYAGRFIRWALGGDECPGADDDRFTSAWLAAGRARRPLADLDELAILGIPADLPDAVTRAGYVWHARAVSENPEGPWQRLEATRIEVIDQPTGKFQNCPATWPTVVLHDRENWASHVAAFTVQGADGSPQTYDRIERDWLRVAWRIESLAQVWPLCLDCFFAHGVCEIGRRMDQPASTYQPNHAYLRPLLEPDRPWSELAALMVWMGLLSKDADVRTSALDVLVVAISDGRACPQRMSEVLMRLLAGGWVKLNRAASALAEAARSSPLHAWFAAETLQGLVAAWEEIPRDAHFVLSLLHELLVDLGTSLTSLALRRLEDIRGTNKTAKTAAALRKLQPQPQSIKLQQAYLQVVESRIERAKRWSVS